MKPIPLLLALSMLAAPAVAADGASRDRDVQAGEAQLAKLTQGLVVGKPTICLPPFRSDDSGTNIPGVGILYGYGSQRWLNRMNGTCDRLGPGDILVIHSHGEICRGDLVSLVESGSRIPHGSCMMGDFIPYAKPPAR